MVKDSVSKYWRRAVGAVADNVVAANVVFVVAMRFASEFVLVPATMSMGHLNCDLVDISVAIAVVVIDLNVLECDSDGVIDELLTDVVTVTVAVAVAVTNETIVYCLCCRRRTLCAADVIVIVAVAVAVVAVVVAVDYLHYYSFYYLLT